MALRFPYALERVPAPVIALGGRSTRPRPLVPVTLLGPLQSHADDAYLDTLADDTVFPERLAGPIGVDLSQLPVRAFAAAGGQTYPVRFTQVKLRLTDGREFREWPAWVGFTPARLRRPLLGYAGCLQYFDTTFYGKDQIVELEINGDYPGT